MLNFSVFLLNKMQSETKLFLQTLFSLGNVSENNLKIYSPIHREDITE